jgi:hypothetical protein
MHLPVGPGLRPQVQVRDFRIKILPGRPLPLVLEVFKSVFMWLWSALWRLIRPLSGSSWTGNSAILVVTGWLFDWTR